MATPANNNPNGNRSRELNVIYFVDSNRTHSFRITISRLVLVSLMLLVLVVWAFLGSFLVYNDHQAKTTMDRHLKDAMSTIFEYQSRYDNVYETAYPNQKAKKKSVLSEISKNNPRFVDIVSQPRNRSYDKFQSLYESINQGELELNVNVNEKPNDWPIKVEDAVLYKEKGSSIYELNFAIRNLKSPLKIEGYIWAVATFVTTKGRRFFVGSPAGVETSGVGDPRVGNENSYEYYGIRYYKAKSLAFVPPVTERAFIVHITIGITDKRKKIESRFDLPVQPEIDASNLPLAGQKEDSDSAKPNGPIARRPATKSEEGPK